MRSKLNTSYISRAAASVIQLSAIVLAFNCTAYGQQLDTPIHSQKLIKTENLRTESLSKTTEKATAKTQQPTKISGATLSSAARTQLKSKILKLQTDANSKMLQRKVEGGIATGGGQTILANNQIGLLDFFVNAPELFYTFDRAAKVPATKNMKSLGLDSFTVNDLDLNEDIKSLLIQWSASSPLAIQFLQSAFLNTRFIFIDQNFSYNDNQFYLPENLENQIQARKTAALYLQPYGVLISKPTFERLSRTNQIGLIVHELFRHLQITYQLNISNEALQKLTVQFVLGPASSNPSLDQNSFIESILLTKYSTSILANIAALDLKMNYCGLPTEVQSLLRSFQSHCLALDMYVNQVIAEKTIYSLPLIKLTTSNDLLINTYNDLKAAYWKTNNPEIKNAVTLLADHVFEFTTLLEQSQLSSRNADYDDAFNSVSAEVISLMTSLKYASTTGDLKPAQAKVLEIKQFVK